MSEAVPPRQIRAVYDDSTIRVYQAYAPHLGLPAARDGRFPAEWKRGRMTWVKPSFLWMMYRSGWGSKEGQEVVLAIDIDRGGFEWALANACLASYDAERHGSREDWSRALKRAPARVQWDPERDLHLRPLPYRSLQLGLAGEASRRYADEWITAIADVTPVARECHALVRAGDPEGARALLPQERPYPVAEGALGHLRG